MNSVTDAFSSMMGLAGKTNNVPPPANASQAQTGGRRRRGTRKGRKQTRKNRKNRKQSRRTRH